MVGGRIVSLLICITYFFAIDNAAHPTPRQALQIIIGGGYFPSPPPETQECPPPPPPPCSPSPMSHPPPPPPSPPPPHPSPPPPSPPPPHPPPPSPPPPPPHPSPPPPPRPPPPPPPPSPKKKQPPPPPPSPKKKQPSPPPPRPSGFESERLQLVYPVIQTFRKKITYDQYNITRTWVGKDICKYRGFICDIVPKYQKKAVAGVKFNNFNFDGPNLTISEFLVGLEDIAFFHANSNNLTGLIPESIGKLPYLFELDLSNNKFTGRFPQQVLKARQLVFLDLRFNTLSGLVPPQVFQLDLDLLFINNNNFVQKLPENLGFTPALYLTFANNKFVGGIPKSIGQASNTLLEVLFLNNYLSGCLPYEIGLLKKSTVFDVGFNDLTGPIPHSFQCLKKMELLNLAQNKFYGSVPEEVCSLPNLSNFTLSYNYFTQVEVKCMKLIKDGILDVKMNCILGLPHQRSAADCAKFFSKAHSCPDEKSLKYVPCSDGYESNKLESSEITRNALVPAQAPLGRSYGALSPH